MSCNSKCSDCSSCPSVAEQQEIKVRDLLGRKKEPISNYLAPLKKPRADKTPLSEKCNCKDGASVPRWQCYQCIFSWVFAVNKQEAEDMAKDHYSKTTKDRIREAIKERIRLRLYNQDSCNCNSTCSCCSDK